MRQLDMNSVNWIEGCRVVLFFVENAMKNANFARNGYARLFYDKLINRIFGKIKTINL